MAPEAVARRPARKRSRITGHLDSYTGVDGIRYMLHIQKMTSTSSEGSFDCKRAATVAEKAVCSDPKLSELDALLGRGFGQARKFAETDPDDQANVAAVAHAFLKQRESCGSARSCLVASYAGAIEGYSPSGADTDLPSWVDAHIVSGGVAPVSKVLPALPGRCVTTKLKGIYPRLGDESKIKGSDFNSGTAVAFENGGYQVSYDRERALLNSKPGDVTVMCLISVPQLCTPGDDRGRFYLVTNTRTRQTWTLPDSEHRCGGA